MSRPVNHFNHKCVTYIFHMLYEWSIARAGFDNIRILTPVRNVQDNNAFYLVISCSKNNCKCLFWNKIFLLHNIQSWGMACTISLKFQQCLCCLKICLFRLSLWVKDFKHMAQENWVHWFLPQLYFIWRFKLLLYLKQLLHIGQLYDGNSTAKTVKYINIIIIDKKVLQWKYQKLCFSFW